MSEQIVFTRVFDALRKRFFASLLDAAITLAWSLVLLLAFNALFSWAVWDAVWLGTAKDCKEASGACWVYVYENSYNILYGAYPRDALWRANAAIAIIWLHFALVSMPIGVYRLWAGVGMYTLLPVSTSLLLYGGVFELKIIPTLYWGGMLLNTVLFAYTIVFMIPIGIVFALMRRSQMPVVSYVARFIIETFRGVPMVTLLFFSTIVLPMFLPAGSQGGKFTRVVVIVSIFAGCYAAEIIRGGLQALPKGQFEASSALALTYWQAMLYIILPQAMQIGFPGFVNMAIGLLKDSTLVLTVGMMDVLNMMLVTNSSPMWLPYFFEGATAVSMLFWVLCFVLSRVSGYWEKRMEVKR